MVALVSLLLIVFVSLLVVRIASSALKMTGLSTESARFQARSAFTGTGFTTAEAESVVRHPVRRRIITILMILRNAGIVTAIASLATAFVKTGSTTEGLVRLFWLLVGLTAIWMFSISRWVDRWLSQLIEWALGKWTSLEVRDYAGLLQLEEGYTVKELLVEEEDWIAGRQLAETRLRDEGIIVLGVTRKNGRYVGAPNGDTRISAGDGLVVYGRGDRIQELDQRVKGALGDLTHEQAVGEQEQEERLQAEEEEAAKEVKEAEAHLEEVEEEHTGADSEGRPGDDGAGPRKARGDGSPS